MKLKAADCYQVINVDRSSTDLARYFLFLFNDELFIFKSVFKQKLEQPINWRSSFRAGDRRTSMACGSRSVQNFPLDTTQNVAARRSPS